ncbi:hypothetical protein EV182_001178, partial [Spiromyces aspiralis]
VDRRAVFGESQDEEEIRAKSRSVQRDGDDGRMSKIQEALQRQLKAHFGNHPTLEHRFGSGSGEAAANDSDESQDEADAGKPKRIKTINKDSYAVRVPERQIELEESTSDERLRQLAQVCVDAAWVHQQSKIPWERQFFSHKVIHVPCNPADDERNKRKRPRRRSRRCRAKCKTPSRTGAGTRRRSDHPTFPHQRNGGHSVAPERSSVSAQPNNNGVTKQRQHPFYQKHDVKSLLNL